MVGIPLPLLIVVSSLLALASGAFLAHSFISSQTAQKVGARLAAFRITSKPREEDKAVNLFGLRAFGKIGLLGNLQRLALHAGHSDQRALARIALYTLSTAAVGAVILGKIALWNDASFTAFIFALCLGTYLGGALPLTLLIIKGKRRRRVIERELPYCLDIMVVLLRGGNSIEQCFRQLLLLGGESFPEIAKATQGLIHDIDHGKAYASALNRWAEVLGLPMAKTLASLFQQALSHGTEISANLVQMSKLQIEERLQAARLRAGRALPQITVVMMLFMLPPMFIILAAPAVTQLIRNLGAMG